MSQQAFIAVSAEAMLQHHALTTFDALWNAPGEPVDKPNRARGGISSVTRLKLAGADGQQECFYLKRQSNYRIRSPQRPLGESTVAREFHNIELCTRSSIPTMEVAFFAERREGGELQAILLTRDLEGYLSMDHWFERWADLDYRLQQNLIRACAAAVARLHASGAVHNCLYPKHLFLKPLSDGMGVRFIDLEKLRAQRLSPWGHMRDLDALNRRSEPTSRTQRLRFLLSYLGKHRVDSQARYWVHQVIKRSTKKSHRSR